MNNYAVLVLSCDKYADLWVPFFSLLDKFWPNRPFPLYLGSNTKKYSSSSVKTILSGKPVDWSTDLLSILGKVKEKYIFLWIDDFFPIAEVHSERFLDGFKLLEQKQANHIHVAPDDATFRRKSGKIFAEYVRGMPYRINACGFWNKEHLTSLLIPGENPWKFEIMGSYRSSYYDGYYFFTQPLIEYIRVVDKGVISKRAYEWCASQGILLDVTRRHVESIVGEVKSAIINGMFQIILLIPWRFRVGIMEKMRKLLASY